MSQHQNRNVPTVVASVSNWYCSKTVKSIYEKFKKRRKSYGDFLFLHYTIKNQYPPHYYIKMNDISTFPEIHLINSSNNIINKI